MAESETSALGGAQHESTDELHGREEPTPCVEDDAEDGAERVESREMKQARKGPTPGIVYLSRIPPFMKPLKVRHLLSQHGEVGRVFLQPEGVCTSTHARSECCHTRSCTNWNGKTSSVIPLLLFYSKKWK